MPDRDQSKPREQARSSVPVDPVAERRDAVRKALERHAKKLARKVEALTQPEPGRKRIDIPGAIPLSELKRKHG